MKAALCSLAVLIFVPGVAFFAGDATPIEALACDGFFLPLLFFVGMAKAIEREIDDIQAANNKENPS